MKALILAAGLGTRLKPITDTIPKALVVAEGKPLLEHALEHVKAYGASEVIINVHHFAGKILSFLSDHGNFGLDISISDETDELLETGGGLKKSAWFFNDGQPFIVRNADVLSNLDLGKMKEFHLAAASLATLAVRKRETSRYFLFDNQSQLSGWENIHSGEKKITREAEMYHSLAFSGIQILDPKIFSLITETGKFSLTDLYLRLSSGQRIMGYSENSSYWKDAGKK